MLKVINLRKTFNNVNVLKGISFEINSGETVVVLGKSGAGKTTLLRCINGLEDFDSDEIILEDKKIFNSNDMKKIRGEVGMVFQNFNLFPHLSVMENIIEAPVNAFGRKKEDAEKNAKELLEMVDLLDKKDYYPHQLSGGQKQRVAIARSCALMPKVICFDEPTSALDYENMEKVVDIIYKFKKTGMSVLIITHDINFADKVADKIIYMRDGIFVEKE